MSYNCCVQGCQNGCCDCAYCVERIFYSTTLPYCLKYRRYCADIRVNCDSKKVDERSLEK